MNLANKLTIARMCMVPFFIFFMELGGIYNSILALFIFCAASITDLFDGRIARKNKTVTLLGIFLDPIADKLLISAAFIYFIKIPTLGIATWMVIIIVAREFVMTGLRSVAASKSVMISADKTGKFKTTSQVVAIIIIMMIIILIVNKAFFEFFGITRDLLNSFCPAMLVVMEKVPFWVTLVIVVLTVYSGVKYVWKYRKLFIEN
ncbi:MAG: CDP-diacylglycerol--glycerol-3-phosphate 3-phosphatidyltransferase [Endomicrobium sp.]|jgi:CDP-diacylglycerol--glycerol-3-phosphate 3-phosphatidyltransferase|nr:CDP-diacylglycerol--glycerol-3-phosphate 3-phosphatidyltransferase [Endomicrobium sp.]